MELETIKFEEQENGISIITLNRPEKLNAMLGNIRNDIVEISRNQIFKN